MPVLITGVEDALGQAISRRMLGTGGEVRVWLDAEESADSDALTWRAGGYKAAIGTDDDEGRLESALEQVHTVVHASGGPLQDPQEATDAFATLVSAALGAGCRRLIWVTDLAVGVTADLDHPPPYVAALDERAALLAEVPMDVVVIRTGLRYGPGDRLTDILGAHPDRLRVAVPHAPVWIDDVAAAVVTADSQRGAPMDVHVAIDLVGPETLPLARIGEGLAAVPGVDQRGTLADEVISWLEIPAVGGPDALGKDGRGFSEGLRLLAATATRT